MRGVIITNSLELRAGGRGGGWNNSINTFAANWGFQYLHAQEQSVEAGGGGSARYGIPSLPSKTVQASGVDFISREHWV